MPDAGPMGAGCTRGTIRALRGRGFCKAQPGDPTAATGRDALAHATEACGSTAAAFTTGACAPQTAGPIARDLRMDIGTSASLSELGVKEADIPLLATNALADACGFTNPRPATQVEIEGTFRGAMVAA